MIKNHANISVFVPHLGCPNKCSFCNQHYIARTSSLPNADTVKEAVETAVKSKSYNPESTEIAFFGGSFTAIERVYMLSLLGAAFRYVQNGAVKGIRISTRPDCINAEILGILKQYGVTAIELGAQSMSDEVLTLNKRGHTAADVVNASKMIKEYGFSLGLQMMTGLYGDDDKKALYTARKIIELKPDTVRIYPTIVLEDTLLADLVRAGNYTPQTLDSAVGLCSELLNMFKADNIRVIRTGLHTIDEEKYLAGPWHPAFKELCDSAFYLKKAKEILTDKGNYEITVNPRELSKMIGQKRENVNKLKELGYNCIVKSNENIEEYQLIIKRM